MIIFIIDFKTFTILEIKKYKKNTEESGGPTHHQLDQFCLRIQALFVVVFSILKG